MKIHNTLTRSTDEFSPLEDSRVKIYTCGPTVYDYQHIGNYASFIRADILVRTLEDSGFDVNWYMNITDVGHLVSDDDTGEDKLEKGARREGKTAWEIAEFYTVDFMKWLTELNIKIDPLHLVKATDHIKQQIELIVALEEKGYTYLIDDGVYFDSAKFPDYGKMARLNIEGLQAGARVEVGGKKNPTDFALWKLSPKDSKRDMEWDSPWGKGFPGWHIECSAMSMNYLGSTLDIHTGGIDHIPIHHTNEIAQSEAATGQQFVRYWFHSNFLQVEGAKIAKSLGNGYNLHDLSERGFTPMDFRMLVLHSHYRNEANFTWEGLSAAKTRLSDLQAAADMRFQLPLEGKDFTSQLKHARDAIQAALQDDLSTPQALAVISTLVAQLNSEQEPIAANESFVSFFEWLDKALGLRLTESRDITEEQKQKIIVRAEARRNQDWAASDKIRDDLAGEGVEIRDTPQGSRWQRS